MSDLFIRTPDPCIDRVNDNLVWSASHLEICLDRTDLLNPWVKAGDPTLQRGPDDAPVDRQKDYPNINRPQDNPDVNRVVDNPEMDRQ